MLTKIKATGIITNHSPESIITKIYELVKSCKQAHHIKSQSGELMGNVYAACEYFDVSDPIMGSRLSVQPLDTNKTIAMEKELDDESSMESTSTLANSNNNNQVTAEKKISKTQCFST